MRKAFYRKERKVEEKGTQRMKKDLFWEEGTGLHRYFLSSLRKNRFPLRVFSDPFASLAVTSFLPRRVHGN